MADHLCTQLGEQAVRERYALLSQACESAAGKGNQQLEQQLQALEQIIEQELPALARKGSPDNITDLLQALRLEMTRFREFCEYPALPSKVVVGLGGSFSAGKSSLINALIGDRQCLVTEVDPTTSLPTYLVRGKGGQTEVHAINLFNRVVSLSHEQFRTLTYEEKSRYGSQVSSLLKSVVVAHPALPWDNLALLDTPGYSKADQAGSERTDANLARTQLNSAQFIVWLVPADKGTITEEDIAFLGTLDRAIPKLVVISRADKHPAEEIEKIVALVRDTLAKRGLSVLDVIPFSNRLHSNYSAEPLLGHFAQWNTAHSELGFAQQFKRQFMAYQRFIDEIRQEAQRQLSKFNRIITLTDDNEIQDDIGIVQQKCKVLLMQSEQLAEELVEVQSRFFFQLKQIGDRVGILLPEPDELSLLVLEPTNFSHLLLQLADERSVEIEASDPMLWAELMRTQHMPRMAQIRPELEPLASHYLTGQENIVQNSYLTLLAANILELGGSSEVQIRLFEMLLVSMKAECSVSFYLQQATALDNIELKEMIVFMKKDEEVINSYLFDLIILMRINGALSAPDVQRLSLQFAIFSVKKLRAHRVIFWVLKMMMGGTTLDEDKLAEDIIASYEGRYGVAHSEFNAVKKFPNLVGNIVNDGVIYVVGVDCDYDNHYNKVSFPACFVTKIHNTLQKNWPLWSNYAGRSNNNNPAVRMIPFLKGLSAWWPMLETTQINAKHEVKNKGGSDDAFVLKNTIPR